MKKQLLILVILPVLLATCGKDFTRLGPVSDRNALNFYKTPTDFEAAVIGAYDALQQKGTFGVNYILLTELRSDNGQNAGGATGLAESIQRIDDFEEIDTDNDIKDTWLASYDGINRTNQILAQIDGVDFPNQGQKDQIKGEALFIRSLLYYHLAVTFGNIPERFEDNLGDIGEADQVPADKIFDRIASDLAEAETLLPPASANGRITSYAAAALQGRVLLQNGKNADAVAPLQRVVDSQEYELVSNFSDIWGVDNKFNKESIFEIQYKSGISEGSRYTDIFTPNGQGGRAVGAGITPIDPTPDVLAAYDQANDARYNGTFAVNPESATGAMYVRKYDSHPTVINDADNNWIEIRYAEVLLNLAEALGEGQDAYDLINEVRHRAGFTAADDIGSSTPGTFEEKLLEERRLEFAFENKRWPDLVRLGKAKEVMAAHLGVAESKIRLIFPIPLGQIDASAGKLTQNTF